MGFAASLGRVVIVVLNILFLLVALGIFAVGMLLRFGEDTVKTYQGTILTALEEGVSAAGYTVDLSSFNLIDLVGNLAIACIAVGVFLLVVAFFGCCGACYKVKCMLILYAVVLVILVIGECVVIGIAFASEDVILKNIIPPIQESIRTDYQGANGTSLISIAMNFFHYQFDCCGALDYTDFAQATQWIKNYPGGVVLVTPITCCKTLPSVGDFTCASTGTATSTNNYMNTGCVSALWKLVIAKPTVVIPVLAGVLVFQLLLIAFSIILARRKDGKVSSS